MEGVGQDGDVRVLIAAATKYGSTLEIARTIGAELTSRGVPCDVVPIEDVADLTGYGAVVLGSAVYAGAWLKTASRFAVTHEAQLAQRHVWLFSSGPLGEVLPQHDDPRQVPDIFAAVGAIDHQMFGGKLDRADVTAFDRLLVRLMGAPYGDFRRWDDVREWAGEIAARLTEH